MPSPTSTIKPARPITPNLAVRRHRRRRAFSLIELITVVVILATIAAIAVPRVSSGAERAAVNAHLADLNRMRNAIELYRVEHEGAFPSSAAAFTAQLTQYTDAAGATSAYRTARYQFGPYLDSIPSIKGGPNKGKNDVGATNDASTAWLYTAATGVIKPNFGGGGGGSFADAIMDSPLLGDGGSITPMGP